MSSEELNVQRLVSQRVGGAAWRAYLAALRAEQDGHRVELTAPCDDPYTLLEVGARGTVTGVDDAGTVHVTWDGGSRLGLIPGLDHWTVLR